MHHVHSGTAPIPTARILGTTTPGLEPVAAAEVAELVESDGERSARGRLRFDTGPEGLARLNRYTRTLNRANVVLHDGAAVESLDWGRYLASGQSFAVRSSRHGDHSFGSPDIARVVGQAVVDTTREAWGDRAPVALNDPDVTLRSFVREDRFTLAVDATGPSLHDRPWRRANHEAAIRPTTAAALVRFAGHESNETLCDPMAGSGTIAVEAALAARNRPVDPTREYPLSRLAFLPDGLLERVRADEPERAAVGRVRAFDTDLEAVAAARENALDGDGFSTYQCTEYGPLGMCGAVLVGEGPGNRVAPLTATVLNGVTVLGAGALVCGVYNHVRETNGEDRRGGRSGPAI